MRDIAAQLLEWHVAERDYAIASIIGIGGSAPRPVGSALAVDADGAVVGSLSGGFMEGAVYQLCRESSRTGAIARETFGYSDSDASAAGLARGGTIEVFVQPVTAANRIVFESILRSAESVALVRDLGTGAAMALGSWWTVGDGLDPTAIAAARALLATGATDVRTVRGAAGVREIFVESCRVHEDPRPHASIGLGPVRRDLYLV
ncbi:XdhC family protein [Nocardia crassostreae]|uniref:XdhC family protein n=1 Tax=Nocardia crassostreae TaxID=53428 RepID=UPI0008322877|nr:XdhC family protein [Nocardia crassostreae]